jgi:hypothetical protein
VGPGAQFAGESCIPASENLVQTFDDGCNAGVLFLNAGIALGESTPNVGLFHAEVEIEIVLVPEEGHLRLEPGRLAGDDVYEGRGFRSQLPRRLVELPSIVMGLAAR